MADISFEFKRPHLEGFPKTFKRCVCKSKKDPNKSVAIRIQEVPQELHEELIEFMVKYYLPDEPLARTTKLIEDQDSLETYKFLFQLVLFQNLSLVALEDGKDGKPIIVGAQLYTVTSLGDSNFPELPGVAIFKLKKLLETISTKEIISAQNVTRYLQDWGLCVDPKYRGWGIAEQILATGNDLGKHIGVNVIITLFTVINSQVLAYRLGYKLINEVKYKEYKDEDGQLVFPGEDKTEAVKLMILNF